MAGAGHANVSAALATRGQKAQELRCALRMAAEEMYFRDAQKRAWARGKPIPEGLPVVKYDPENAAGPVDYQLMARADIGGGMAQAFAASCGRKLSSPKKKSRSKKGAIAQTCEGCGGGDLNIMSNAARCGDCGKAYHLQCWGGPELNRAPASIKKSPPWQCADCLKCSACARTQRALGPANKVKKEKIGAGVLARMESLCRDCADVYKAGEYCPICHQTWDASDPKMVQCDQCLLWTHAACADLDDETLKAVQDGTHEELGRQFLCAAGCAARLTTRLVNKLITYDPLGYFSAPVDAAAVPGYAEVVKFPMDLSTMKVKAEKGEYRAAQPVRADAELMVRGPRAERFSPVWPSRGRR